MQPHSNVRFIIDKRKHHPFAVKHRLQYFARQARKILFVEQETPTLLVLKVCNERS